MTPAGIEPATFQFVAQNLNHLCHRGPLSASFMKNILFEQKKIKLLNEWHFMEKKTEIMQHVV